MSFGRGGGMQRKETTRGKSEKRKRKYIGNRRYKKVK
jgi:hypothetical protein